MKIHVILILGYIALVSFQSKQELPFDKKVSDFLIRYKLDYNESSDRFAHANYNDRTLGAKVQSQWNKTITLKSKTLFTNKYDQKVYPSFYLGFYQFSSPSTCKQAYDQLLECMGTDCGTVQWGKTKAIKSPPFIYIKTHTEIVFCKTKCEHDSPSWKRIKDDLRSTFVQEKSQVIEANCGSIESYQIIE